MLYRTIFISDLHLGTRGCSVDVLLDFLKHNESETLYLVGDIIDGWRLKRKWYWPQSHNDVVQKLLRKSRKGTKIIWISGNHDEFLRELLGISIGGIEIRDEVVHTTAHGMRLLVLHGDRFDGITTYHKWLALLGDWSYTVLLEINKLNTAIRRRFGFGHWSLSAFIKHKAKMAVNFINDYETSVADECKRRDFDGVISGHIHHAEIREIDDVIYFNTGDMVESCTALVEDFDGNLMILSVREDCKPLVVYCHDGQIMSGEEWIEQNTQKEVLLVS